MKLPTFRFCAYRVTHINILPALLWTTMYSVNEYCPMFSQAEYINWGKRSSERRDVDTPVPYPKAGFRLAFKFLKFHLGTEVRYEPRRVT